MLRSPARLFAPLALVACAIAILVIVNRDTGSGDATGPKTATTRSTATTTASQGAKKTRHTYIVKSGDVLSQIAIRTGVPLETLQQLNPGVDAQSLHVGQKLKLAP
jgi:LysM repeat protein